MGLNKQRQYVVKMVQSALLALPCLDEEGARDAERGEELPPLRLVHRHDALTRLRGKRTGACV